MSKKKDQEKFTEYSINTDDAWEIDDNTMSLNILDSNFNDNSEICKQTNAEVPPRTANQQQSSTVVLDSSA
ncbi:unnamed protein product, partial [Rotaria magnacalcarata]